MRSSAAIAPDVKQYDRIEPIRCCHSQNCEEEKASFLPRVGRHTCSVRFAAEYEPVDVLAAQCIDSRVKRALFDGRLGFAGFDHLGLQTFT